MAEGVRQYYDLQAYDHNSVRPLRKNRAQCAKHCPVNAASTVEHTILRFQVIADNGGRHTEHVLCTFLDYLYVLNKAVIRHLGGGGFKLFVFFPG